MKILIDKEKCVGCAACVSICSEIFEIKGDKANVKAGIKEDSKSKKCAKNAAGVCPANAIKVTD